MKNAILFLSLAFLPGFAGCAKNPETGTTNANTAIFEAPPLVEQTDGSTITTTTAPNGIKSEVRSFPQGVLIQISRASWPDGRRAATVRFRDGRAVDLQDAADIEQVMTASSDAIAAIALKTAGIPDAPPNAANANQAGDKKENKKADKKGQK